MLRVVSALAGGVLSLGLFAGESAAGTTAQAAFEKLKALAGTWQGKTANGKTATATYKLTANDTVVVEEYSVEGSANMNMQTMYHLDGANLILTHYCSARNQPRMRADLERSGNDVVEFSFLDATNLKSPNDGHMYKAVFKFQSPDQVDQEWTFRQSGKDAFTETVQYRRKK